MQGQGFAAPHTMPPLAHLFWIRARASLSIRHSVLATGLAGTVPADCFSPKHSDESVSSLPGGSAAGQPRSSRQASAGSGSETHLKHAEAEGQGLCITQNHGPPTAHRTEETEEMSDALQQS